MATETKLIKMRRHAPQFPNGPVEAEVHPEEESSYAAGGWTRAPQPAAEAQPKGEKEKK